MRFTVLLVFVLACTGKSDETGYITDANLDTAADDTGPVEVDPLVEGQNLVQSSCTNACHSGQNMGSRSSRFADDAELASVIRGDVPGPMQGIGAATSWSDSDMTNAIAYMRSLE